MQFVSFVAGCNLIALWAWILVGCGGTAVPEPTTIPPTHTLLPVSATEEATMTAVPSPTTQPTEENEAQTGVVTPVTVNLGEITPSPVATGTLIIQPAPGVPDPTAALVHRMTMDLAGRLSIDISQIQVVSTEEVIWPDSGLGCPRVGTAVMDVLTPGFKVVLQAQGQQYEYHSQDTSVFVLCKG